MIQAIKEYFLALHHRIWGSFGDSGTIMWARFQLVFASVWYTAVNYDWSPYIHDPHMLAYYMFANAFVSEYIRRRKDPDIGGA